MSFNNFPKIIQFAIFKYAPKKLYEYFGKFIMDTDWKILYKITYQDTREETYQLPNHNLNKSLTAIINRNDPVILGEYSDLILFGKNKLFTIRNSKKNKLYIKHVNKEFNQIILPRKYEKMKIVHVDYDDRDMLVLLENNERKNILLARGDNFFGAGKKELKNKLFYEVVIEEKYKKSKINQVYICKYEQKAMILLENGTLLATGKTEELYGRDTDTFVSIKLNVDQDDKIIKIINGDILLSKSGQLYSIKNYSLSKYDREELKNNGECMWKKLNLPERYSEEKILNIYEMSNKRILLTNSNKLLVIGDNINSELGNGGMPFLELEEILINGEKLNFIGKIINLFIYPKITFILFENNKILIAGNEKKVLEEIVKLEKINNDWYQIIISEELFDEKIICIDYHSKQKTLLLLTNSSKLFLFGINYNCCVSLF